jgi:hypothetical protein
MLYYNYCNDKTAIKQEKEDYSMSTVSNPRIEEIRHRVRVAYNELNQLLDGPIASMDTARIYHSPEPGEWTIMQNLAHIIEFLPYWGNEAAKLVAHPGQKFGRTRQDEGRVRAIAEHGSDSLAQARAALPESYEYLDKVLRQLQDSDLELTGHHPTWGEHNLAWFIDESVAKHLEDHVLQIKSCF